MGWCRSALIALFRPPPEAGSMRSRCVELGYKTPLRYCETPRGASSSEGRYPRLQTVCQPQVGFSAQVSRLGALA
jgi:hypothetical protein